MEENMPTVTISAASKTAEIKVERLEGSLIRYLILAILAGAYVGFGIALILSVGAPFKAAGSPAVKIIMGVSFGIALSLVIFAGSELFTGNNMFLMIGVLNKTNKWTQMIKLWFWSYIGNLIGSVIFAWIIIQTGILGHSPQADLLQGITSAKMNAPLWNLFWKGILCNWLVCLAIWTSARTKNDAAKLILIFWCLFAFISCGFEHSVANMTVLSLGLLNPHPDSISILGMVRNLIPVTLGNIVGGALFVGGAYWVANPER